MKRCNFKKNKNTGGYLLVEMLVSLTIFAFVVTASATALLAIMDANSKSQAMRVIMDNLNISVENMSRTIRVGTSYRGGDASGDSCDLNCPQIFFNDQFGNGVSYYLTGTSIHRIQNGNDIAITAPEAIVQNLNFSIRGTGLDDGQPRVLMVIGGQAGIAGSVTPFTIQTSVSQRQLDCDDSTNSTCQTEHQ